MKGFLVVFFVLCFCYSNAAINSIETGYTIMQVRTAKQNESTRIIGTSYEGTLVCFSYDGTKLWENKLSGYMNHDINCGDIDNDGNDEIIAANANGTIYCIDDDGSLLWSFKQNDAPMYTACIVESSTANYIACGGFDKQVYYVSTEGKELNHFHSTTYSIDKQAGKYDHAMNFMRHVKIDGEDVLVLHSSVNTNWSQGSLYFFRPLATTPFKTINASQKKGACYGTFSVNNLVPNSTEILLGGNNLSKLPVASITVESEEKKMILPNVKNNQYGKTGYRLASVEAVPNNDSFLYYILWGSRMFIVSPNDEAASSEVVIGQFAYNGMCKDQKNGNLLLASSQSGGSCIHVIDYTNSEWKTEFENLIPKGKISSIINNTANFKSQLAQFERPEWEREANDVLILDAGVSKEREQELAQLDSNCPMFISGAGIYPHVENWDRSSMENDLYRDKRDTRKSYDYTSDQVVSKLNTAFQSAEHGIQFWSGHGSDPYYYSLPTLKKAIDKADGKYMIPVFAELETYDEDFQWMTEDFMLPLAEYFKPRNGLISLRNKHLFWQSIVYTPAWRRLISGDFADVFVSSMEESNSKTMDMSVSGRMGLWASGAMNKWGTRFTRDNPCYDRLRQLSYQRLPNHSLRMFVYNIASGASVVHNTVVDESYTDVLWYMLAKGILYVPNRDEIVSFNPVHLSMLTPDDLFLDGNHVKIITNYDEDFEKANPLVVGHTNGTWAGAPVPEWDFSNYATGGMERRMEFLPPYPNGMVLTTPPTEATSKRGELSRHLNPIYKNIMQEMYTDGRNYYSDSFKSTTIAADTYGPTIKAAIQKAAEKLPLTVEGRVAWVTAQTDPLHLRLTLVDGGYVNPDDREVTIQFHTAKVKSITNLINNQEILFANNKATASVPCGLFTFLDIELLEPLEIANNDPTSNDPKNSNSIRVIGAEKQITIIGAENKSVQLINSLGQTISRHKALSTNETIPAPTGIILVKVDKEVHKVIVR